MSKFKSFLANDIEGFISFRRSLGFIYDPNDFRSLFSSFDKYLKEKGKNWDDLTPAFILEFRSQLSLEPYSINRRMSALRVLFDYLVRLDRITQNPVKNIPNLKVDAFVPFIFSDEQVDQLLKAIQIKIRPRNKAHFLTDLGVYTIISLIARCGLRISEPLKLKDDHFRSNEATIYIENSKFGKDRLIPIPSSVVCMINNFVSIRNSIIDKNECEYIFTSAQGRITTRSIYPRYDNALKDLNFNLSRQKFTNITFGKPTPHSLRHSFAVNTLKNASKKGKKPENILPVLAAYMGHADYRYTMMYLKVIDSELRNSWVDFYSYKKNCDKSKGNQ